VKATPGGSPAKPAATRRWPLRVAALLLAALILWPLAAPRAAAAAPAVEVLRLRVAAEQRQAWVAAERESWLPWLEHQPGFLGKEVYWDPAHQEAVVLIRWASREQWKAIPQGEVAALQRRFEQRARTQLQLRGLSPPAEGNPFPLVGEGEWLALAGPGSDPSAGSQDD
jgi:uncharacterized protein (TIGR03792 family)